jgi:DNA-binding LacI/PurR family transcriptional regulator
MAGQDEAPLAHDPRPSRPTLAELARAAGVNKSTVSRALSGYRAIGSKTRERIQRLAADLHYEPNASARRLFRAQTDVLAFAALRPMRGDEGADPFLSELLSTVAKEAAEHQQDLLLCSTEPGPQELETYRRVVGGRHADGIILMDMRPGDPRLEYLCGKGYPHVLFGRAALDMEQAQQYPYPWIEVDNRTGARTGAEHLIALGHTRIAFLERAGDSLCDHDRFAGYRDALAAADMTFDPGLYASGGLNQEDGYQLTRRILAGPTPPTAIFAASDVLAVGAMRAAHDAGFVVGRDLAVMGFDGLGLATFVSPPLTTLRQPIADVGRLLVQRLIGIVRGEPAEESHVLLQPELIVRASTCGT